MIEENRIKWKRSFALIGLLLLSRVNLQCQQAQITGEIAKIIHYEANIDFTLVPSVLVGVMDGDSIYVSSFGEAIEAGSIFELGSVTKPFVDWLARKALDSLGWSTESSVCTFLPDSLCQKGWEEISIDQLLMHQVGLVRFPPNIIESSALDPYQDYDVHHLSQDIMRLKPIVGKYSYSHIGYAMLYWLFEKVGGMESFAKQKLGNSFSCLGWNHAEDKIAQGHGMDGRKQPTWHFKALAPAMGLQSCMSDFLKFVHHISPALALKTPERTTALKKELKALARSDAYMVVDGWFLIESGPDLVYYHTGRTGGHQVSVALIPQKRKGVVVFSNGALGSNELSLLVLNMINHAKIKK